MGRPEWRRTEFAVTSSVFTFFAGFNFIQPFLPLYIRELGDFSVTETGLWAGVIMSATPLISGLTAPLWGMLADRFGRKLMLQRSLLGFSVALGLMGLAQAPWHLLAIKIGMGFVGGFSATSAALVSVTSPADRVTSSIGRVQAARVVGLAVGPLPGGLLADAVGYRSACFLSMGAGIVALAIVTVMASERIERPASRGRGEGRVPATKLLGNAAFLSILCVVLVGRVTERSFEPILPLLVGDLDMAFLGTATSAAIITSAGLMASAVTAALTGRLVQAGARGDSVLRWMLVACAVVLLPLVVIFSWWQLLGLRLLAGAALGVVFTLAFSTAATDMPRDRRGLTLSVLGSGTSYGSSIGFLVAGFMSSVVSLSSVFVLDACLLLLAAWFHGRSRRGAAT